MRAAVCGTRSTRILVGIGTIGAATPCPAWPSGCGIRGLAAGAGAGSGGAQRQVHSNTRQNQKKTKSARSWASVRTLPPL